MKRHEILRDAVRKAFARYDSMTPEKIAEWRYGTRENYARMGCIFAEGLKAPATASEVYDAIQAVKAEEGRG